MQPRVGALLDRRILVNYRVDPDVAAAVLPAPFRPVIVGGHAIAGICLIRLGRISPAGLRQIDDRERRAPLRGAVGHARWPGHWRLHSPPRY